MAYIKKYSYCLQPHVKRNKKETDWFNHDLPADLILGHVHIANCMRGVLKKFIDDQLLETFPTFYRSKRFSTDFVYLIFSYLLGQFLC
jgi:hypothetical protein